MEDFTHLSQIDRSSITGRKPIEVGSIVMLEDPDTGEELRGDVFAITTVAERLMYSINIHRGDTIVERCIVDEDFVWRDE